MANVSQFVFFDAQSTNQISNEVGMPPDASALMMQVTKLNSGASINFSIEGLCDLKDPNYSKVKAVDMSDFSTNNVITKEGNYMLITQGMYKLRANSTVAVGGIKVFTNFI